MDDLYGFDLSIYFPRINAALRIQRGFSGNLGPHALLQTGLWFQSHLVYRCCCFFCFGNKAYVTCAYLWACCSVSFTSRRYSPSCVYTIYKIFVFVLGERLPLHIGPSESWYRLGPCRGGALL